MSMNQRERDALDRHITGNYGEDQFKGEPDDEAPDTTNRFLVAMQGDRIKVMLAHQLMTGISAADALNLAAWLVAMAETYGDSDFEKLLAAVRST